MFYERKCTMLTDVIRHYDLLIDENNDPVYDPKPLQDYMNKWDGVEFIEKMNLDRNKSVLEVGVGSGRLAVQVAPLCGRFCGIDVSPKTAQRAERNLSSMPNTQVICGDFLTYAFDRSFDVIYSSLTWMHIEDKQSAINKIAALLNPDGLFVLSVDKNPDEFIDTGTRKIRVYPDDPEMTAKNIRASGLTLLEQYDNEFAVVFVAVKK